MISNDIIGGGVQIDFPKFGYKARELESLRCIVSHLERVVDVRPTYVLFSLDTHAPKGHLNIYMTLVLSRSSVEGRVIG